MSGESANKLQDSSIDDDAELMALEALLAAADDNDKTAKSTTEAVKSKVPCLREDSTFAEAFSYEVDLPAAKLKQMATGTAAEEVDSSDDEEVKNFLERKYNEYGADINKKLKQDKEAQHEKRVANEVNASLSAVMADESCGGVKQQDTDSFGHIKNPHNPVVRHSKVSSSFTKAARPQARQPAAETTPVVSTSTFTDPVFGLRIIKPLVSSALLVERMSGRKPVPFSALAFHVQHGDLSKDWVIAGAVINKSPVRLSKKGEPFSIWRLSDMRGDIKMASIFLFGGAHKALWKTAQGMCVAVLNPSIFEKRAQSGDVACLSIDTAHKLMILGQSKDMGICKAKKKNGEPCTSVVNLGECDYCIYHMKQEYGKMARRSELQSATAGRGLNELRNKVLGKSEVFYGGQSFTAVPARKSAKMTAKDALRIGTLSEYANSPFAASVNHTPTPKLANTQVPYARRDGPISKVAANIEACGKQRVKDLERLKVLQTETAAKASSENGKTLAATKPISTTTNTVTAPVASTSAAAAAKDPPISALAVPEKFKDRAFSFAPALGSPQLSRDNFCIEVNVGERQAQAAKRRAMEVLKQRPIQKVNPNSTRGSEDGKRRAIDELNEKFDSESKRQKIDEAQREVDRKSRLQRIMDATSSHTNLVDLRELQEQDKYFDKLEKKEALEEKMLNTFKMACKAVICLRCKYTAFSAHDRCKEEKHPLKVVDAEKRFFQCKDCGNRTASVFKFPKIACSNCKGSRWQRSAMIRERKICTGAEELSLRGDEESFIGSLASKANLSLLVPDE